MNPYSELNCLSVKSKEIARVKKAFTSKSSSGRPKECDTKNHFTCTRLVIAHPYTHTHTHTHTHIHTNIQRPKTDCYKTKESLQTYQPTQ